ncbi:MAG: hypothetical protein WCD57_16965, partial [Acidobacteriaceae bacterium]
LLMLVALANLMRLSLKERRTRSRVQRSVAGNPGRDDRKGMVVVKERAVAKGQGGCRLLKCEIKKSHRLSG